MTITEPSSRIDLNTGELTGQGIVRIVRKLGDLKGVFKDTAAFESIDPEQIAYEVEMESKVPEGKSGGLFFGTSFLHPGQVGDEYFITKGHFHSNLDTAEYYWCIRGEGVLILMDKKRNCKVEAMKPGSLHYIPGKWAHRIANVGDTTLVVGACWPSDAGHDYGSIAKNGFPFRLINKNGVPTLVEDEV